VNNVINLRTAPKAGDLSSNFRQLRNFGNGNPHKTSATTVGVTVGIRTGEIQNTHNSHRPFTLTHKTKSRCVHTDATINGRRAIEIKIWAKNSRIIFERVR
jgi:hypothetical protein